MFRLAALALIIGALSWWGASLVSPPPQPRPFAAVQEKLSEGQAATILVWSDSTGNGSAEPREWPYLLGDWLADKYPASPVRLWQWLEDPEGYADAATLSKGRGGPEITIANFAVPGANMAYGMGQRWQPAIARWSDPDLIIVNLGLNYAGYEDEGIIRPLFEEGISRLGSQFPGAPVLLLRQNPFSDNDTMDLVYRIIDDIARKENMAIADVADLFKANRDRDLYLGRDNTHPNQAGQDLYLEAVTSLW